jgi:predicted alpha/beta hydrolase
MESRRAEELRRGTAAVENENVTLPKRDWLRGVDGEVAASRRSCGHVFGGGSVGESAHELAGVEAGAVLGRSARWRRERKREGVVARVRAETVVVATLKAWWPNGWDHG